MFVTLRLRACIQIVGYYNNKKEKRREKENKKRGLVNITIQTGEAQRAQKGSNEEGRKKIKKNQKEQQIKGEETKDDGFKKEKRKRVAI